MRNAVTVLVSSAGRRVELLGRFRAAATRLGVELTLVATDADPTMSAACHYADSSARVPTCGDPAFAEALLSTCRAAGVDVVVPTIDPELIPLAASTSAFEQEGIHVVVSPLAVVEVARDKRRTFETLRQHVAVPATWSIDEARTSPSVTFPVIVKPIDGSSSIGVRLAREVGDLPHGADGWIAQERLVGSEVTVNAFVAADGRLVAAVPHVRLAVRDGEISKGKVWMHPALLEAAESVVRALPDLRGPFCFQAFVADDIMTGVFEINARFGGGYPLADAAGAPFAEWILREHMRMPLPDRPVIVEGLTMLRHDQSVFFGP